MREATRFSVFRVDVSSSSHPLTFRDIVSSGGIEPVSIAIHRPFVYVLNAGSTISQGNIAGFRLLAGGQLVPLPGSTQPLSQTGATGPAQISFNPSGTVLVVTEKATSLLDAYTVNAQGVASGPTHTPLEREHAVRVRLRPARRAHRERGGTGSALVLLGLEHGRDRRHQPLGDRPSDGALLGRRDRERSVRLYEQCR